MQVNSLPVEPQGKPKNTGVGSLQILSPVDLPDPGIELGSPALQADSLPAEPPGKPKNTGVGSLSLLQWIFLTQELNWGLLHCRQILYQLSCQRSPSEVPGFVITKLGLDSGPLFVRIHSGVYLTIFVELLSIHDVPGRRRLRPRGSRCGLNRQDLCSYGAYALRSAKSRKPTWEYLHS